MSGTLSPPVAIGDPLDVRLVWEQERTAINVAAIFFNAAGAVVGIGSGSITVTADLYCPPDSVQQLNAAGGATRFTLQLELPPDPAASTLALVASRSAEFQLGAGATRARFTAPAPTPPSGVPTTYSLWVGVKAGLQQ